MRYHEKIGKICNDFGKSLKNKSIEAVIFCELFLILKKPSSTTKDFLQSLQKYL